MRASFEQAKTLKHAGYDIPCAEYYSFKGELVTGGGVRNLNKTRTLTSAPTLDDVCDWLREVHRLHVCATPDGYCVDGGLIWVGVVWSLSEQLNARPEIPRNNDGTYASFKTFRLAHSAAVDLALQTILKKK